MMVSKEVADKELFDSYMVFSFSIGDANNCLNYMEKLHHSISYWPMCLPTAAKLRPVSRGSI